MSLLLKMQNRIGFRCALSAQTISYLETEDGMLQVVVYVQGTWDAFLATVKDEKTIRYGGEFIEHETRKCVSFFNQIDLTRRVLSW